MTKKVSIGRVIAGRSGVLSRAAESPADALAVVMSRCLPNYGG